MAPSTSEQCIKERSRVNRADHILKTVCTTTNFFSLNIKAEAMIPMTTRETHIYAKES
jgi:hypothetical protein